LLGVQLLIKLGAFLGDTLSIPPYQFITTTTPCNDINDESMTIKDREGFKLVTGLYKSIDPMICIELPHNSFLIGSNSTRVDIKWYIKKISNIMLSYKNHDTYYIGWTTAPGIAMGDNNPFFIDSNQLYVIPYETWSWINYVCNFEIKIQHRGGIKDSYMKWLFELTPGRISIE